MTSQATSYAGGTTAGNFTLIFSGATIGTFIEDFSYEEERLTEVAEKQNFWATEVIIDGRHPAQIYRSTFKLYTETGSLGGIFDAILGLNSLITEDPQLLTVNDGTGATVRYNFGQCYFKAPARPETPARFNRHEAMIFEVDFVGKTLPTVV